MDSALILLYPFDDVNQDFLERIKTNCYDALPGSFPQLEVEDTALAIPKQGYVEHRKQYRASAFLTRLEEESPRSIHAIGLVDEDLFTPKLNFVFGVAQPEGNAVVALSRLKPQFYGKPKNSNLFELRVVKEILHELGHIFRLRHCDNHCVMRFSNKLSQTDLKPAEYCESCYTDLQAITQNDLER
ncbi:MAG: archaemetzincin family Zn-dependent metalloprotease [Candidatus Thorarchaeota archaeon]|nr:archaemetzincin family Zn-dependent metalloprotease [Candidatus Thorarchaeota archaeon]